MSKIAKNLFEIGVVLALVAGVVFFFWTPEKAEAKVEPKIAKEERQKSPQIMSRSTKSTRVEAIQEYKTILKPGSIDFSKEASQGSLSTSGVRALAMKRYIKIDYKKPQKPNKSEDNKIIDSADTSENSPEGIEPTPDDEPFERGY